MHWPLCDSFELHSPRACTPPLQVLLCFPVDLAALKAAKVGPPIAKLRAADPLILGDAAADVAKVAGQIYDKWADAAKAKASPASAAGKGAVTATAATLAQANSGTASKAAGGKSQNPTKTAAGDVGLPVPPPLSAANVSQTGDSRDKKKSRRSNDEDDGGSSGKHHHSKKGEGAGLPPLLLTPLPRCLSCELVLCDGNSSVPERWRPFEKLVRSGDAKPQFLLGVELQRRVRGSSDSSTWHIRTRSQVVIAAGDALFFLSVSAKHTACTAGRLTLPTTRVPTFTESSNRPTCSSSSSCPSSLAQSLESVDQHIDSTDLRIFSL